AAWAGAPILPGKKKTPPHKSRARIGAKRELFSARLRAVAEILRRRFRNVASADHTLSSFVTRLRERPQHCSRKPTVRATLENVGSRPQNASVHSSTKKISEWQDELRCCFHKGSASWVPQTIILLPQTTAICRSSSTRNCRARPNCRASYRVRRRGRANIRARFLITRTATAT